MELHKVSVDLKAGEEIIIMPVGDIQYTGPNGDTDMDRLRRHIQWGADRGAWFVGMGDYIDFASPSNRRALDSAGLYESSHEKLVEAAKGTVEELFDSALMPSKDRWLGLIHGHHWSKLDLETSDQYLASLLRSPYLGTSAWIQVDINGPEGSGPLNIVVHHGKGSGATIGFPLNTIDRWAGSWENVHVFLMGHTHQVLAAAGDILRADFDEDGGRIKSRTRLLVNTGGFMRGYREGKRVGGRPGGSYVEEKMLRPTALGAPVLYVRPRILNGEWEPDIRVSL